MNLKMKVEGMREKFWSQKSRKIFLDTFYTSSLENKINK